MGVVEQVKNHLCWKQKTWFRLVLLHVRTYVRTCACVCSCGYMYLLLLRHHPRELSSFYLFFKIYVSPGFFTVEQKRKEKELCIIKLFFFTIKTRTCRMPRVLFSSVIRLSEHNWKHQLKVLHRAVCTLIIVFTNSALGVNSEEFLMSEVHRWCGEPIKVVLLPTDIFLKNKKGMYVM